MITVSILPRSDVLKLPSPPPEHVRARHSSDLGSRLSNGVWQLEELPVEPKALGK